MPYGPPIKLKNKSNSNNIHIHIWSQQPEASTEWIAIGMSCSHVKTQPYTQIRLISNIHYHPITSIWLICTVSSCIAEAPGGQVEFIEILTVCRRLDDCIIAARHCTTVLASGNMNDKIGAVQQLYYTARHS